MNKKLQLSRQRLLVSIYLAEDKCNRTETTFYHLVYMYLFMVLFSACSPRLVGNNCNIPCRYPNLETNVRAYATVTYWLAKLSPIAIVKLIHFEFCMMNIQICNFYLFLTICQHTFHFMLKHCLIKILFSSCCLIQSSINVHIFFYNFFYEKSIFRSN